jgi:hypothetical protein
VFTPFLNEHEEIRNTRLKGRIYTENFRYGADCPEIAITGRYIFDKIKSENLFSKNVCLIKGEMIGGKLKTIPIEQINYPSKLSLRIAPPHHATLLSLRSLPVDERKGALRKFVSAYFELVANRLTNA